MCHLLKIALLIIPITFITETQCEKIFQDEAATLNITNEFNVWIRIECHNITEYREIQQLINDQTPVVKNETVTVKLYDCPLPDNRESLASLLQIMGIFAYRNLLVKNDHFMTTNLTREHFKHVQQLQRLTLQLRHLTQLPTDVFAETALRNLTALDLYTNAANLPQGTFSYLENLQYLHLGHNLESLWEVQFQKQGKLLHLNLSKNKLIKIPAETFANNAAIQFLQLENNFLETLPSNIFDKLSSLTTVDINLNSFENLTAGLFSNTCELQEFIFTRTRRNLLRLPDKFLANLLQLTKVEISCGLESLPAKIFFDSKNLKEIILKGNNLRQLPDNLLESQALLLYLDVSHNRLKGIPADLLQNTSELKILILANNQLRAIERNSLAHLKRLELLDLSSNQLNSQDFRIKLEISFSLKYLYLQNNSLTDLSVLLGHLPQNLHRLNLSFNRISQLLGKNLGLLFTDNLILNLTYNQIQTIQVEDFQKQNIYLAVDLNNNPLKCDCRLTKSMTYLAGLYGHLQFHTDNLRCEEPSRLRGSYVKGINKMELLCLVGTTYLSGYKCAEKCQCWLRSYDKFLVVDCSNRNLTQVPVLQSLKGFELKGLELNLSLNQITQLPSSSAPGYANCTKLLLAYNELSTVDKTQIPANSTLLDLRHNHLTHLHEDTLSHLASKNLLENILLSGNQWQCECTDSGLLLFSTTQLSNEKFTDASQMTCHNFPATKFVAELQDLCHRKEIIWITAVCLSLVFIFLLIALVFIYKNHIKIWLYGHDFCRRFVTKYDEGDCEHKVYDAFVSYSHKDEDFVANHLLPELENGHPPYKLCVHARDFLVGEYIPDQIVNAIAESRRVIVVLSRNFILSEWAQLEFKEAYRATLLERRQKLIIIMYEDIGREAALDKELKIYLKMNTYLKWGDPGFWQKLRFSMPHK